MLSRFNFFLPIEQKLNKGNQKKKKKESGVQTQLAAEHQSQYSNSMIRSYCHQ